MAFRFVYDQYPEIKFADVAGLSPEELKAKLSSTNKAVDPSPAAVSSTASTSTSDDFSADDLASLESTLSQLALAASVAMESISNSSALEVFREPAKRFYHDLAYALSHNIECEKIIALIDLIYTEKPEFEAIKFMFKELIKDLFSKKKTAQDNEVINCYLKYLAGELIAREILTELPNPTNVFLDRYKAFTSALKNDQAIKETSFYCAITFLDETSIKTCKFNTKYPLYDAILLSYSKILAQIYKLIYINTDTNPAKVDSSFWVGSVMDRKAGHEQLSKRFSVDRAGKLASSSDERLNGHSAGSSNSPGLVASASSHLTFPRATGNPAYSPKTAEPSPSTGPEIVIGFRLGGSGE